MAARSPSPNPSRPANTRPKTPDSSIRRSGSFSLSKPSISSEAPHKNSVSKPGRDILPCLRASFEQKENEREPNGLKTPRARSSVDSTSKGAKNFMSPTISATSKSIASTPRKKVLAERNEVSTVSDSVQFPQREEIALKSEVGYGARMVLGPLISSKVGVEEFGSDFQEILGSVESRRVDPESKNQKYVVVPSLTPSPTIAPVDANPSFRPYDPKTNYLSPRPRFLCYKPKPRFEQCRDMEGGLLDVEDGRRLEDSLSSEIHEDTSGSSEEEAQSSLPQQECEDVSSPNKLVAEEVINETLVPEPESQFKPSGDHFKPRPSPNKVIDEIHVPEPESPSKPKAVAEEVINETLVPKPKSQFIPSGDHFKPRPSLKKVLIEEVIDKTHIPEPKSPSKPSDNHFKPRPFARSKFIPVLFVLVMACLYAPLSDSPLILSSSVLKSHSFEIPSLQALQDLNLKDYATLANVHLNQIADRFRHWCIAYLSSMASVPEQLGSILPVNLTFSDVDQTVGLDFIYSATAPNQGHMESETEQAVNANMVEEESGFRHDPEYDSHEIDPLENVYEGENIVMEKEVEEESTSDYVSLDIAGLEVGNIVMQVPEDVKEGVHPAEYGLKNIIEEDDMKRVEQYENPTPKLFETEGDIREELESTSSGLAIENQDSRVEPAGSGDSLSDSVEGYQMANSIESSEFSEIGSEDNLLIQSFLGISLAITTMLAVAMVILRVKRNPGTADAHQGLSPKKLGSVSGSSESYRHVKGPHFHNVPVCMDIVGDTGPSEVSSSLHSSSSFRLQRGRRSKEEENLSHERRRMRRDSTVSSMSYGSFTTYERISAKKGCQDEDAATPVRRSSRIRNNQVTSP